MRLIPVFILVLLIATTAQAAAPDWSSPFGIVCPWAGLKPAGIDWVRCGAGATALGNWCDIEKQKGTYTWDGSDNELKSDLQQGLTPLPILGYTPEWASSGPKKEASAPPTDLLDYAAFVRKTVSRYKDRVSCWEVWNEPDIGFFTGTISQYSDLLKTAYTAAKTADPKCRIVFGGTAGVNIPFIEGVYESGGGSFFDVMAVHPYQWGDNFNDDWFVSQLADLRKLMNSHGDSNKEIWLTELGWSTGDAGITEEVQARLLTQALVTSLTLRRMGVTRAFWFCVKDWGGPGYGLLRPDGSQKPAYKAYSVLTSTLRGADYVGRLAPGEDVRFHLFSGGPRKTFTAVIWAPRQALLRLPATAGTRAFDHMGESIPVQVTDGRCYLLVKPQPVFVVGVDPRILKQAQLPKLPAFAPKPMVATKASAVWASVVAPESTRRTSLVAGAKSPVTIRLQNQGSAKITGNLLLKLNGASQGSGISYSLEPWSEKMLTASVGVPATGKPGLVKLTVTGQGIAPAVTVVRVDDKRVIEFPANSTTEGKYLFVNNGSGGSPSVRFNGNWTYKFDLSDSRSARVELNIGAHNANEWRVLASNDNQQWKEIVSGKSNRSWHTAALDEFVGRPLYLKFEGNDQQLGELILHY